MALKIDRQIDAYELGFKTAVVAEQGTFLVFNAAGSGVSLDEATNTATVSATASGTRPLGVLLSEVVDYDSTKQQGNYAKDEVDLGNKVSIATKGWVVTDKVLGTPTAGDFAVLSASGCVSGIAPDAVAWDEVVNPFIGRFRSSVDANGYARVYVDL